MQLWTRPRRPHRRDLWLVAIGLLLVAVSLGGVLPRGRAEAQETAGPRALPALLADLARQAGRLHDAGAPADAERLAAGSKPLRDAMGLRAPAASPPTAGCRWSFD